MNAPTGTSGVRYNFDPIRDEEGRDVYCLQLRESQGGRFYVQRATWWLWGGKVTPVNPVRVSPYYVKRESTKAFCMGYAADNPGCLTLEKATALAGEAS